jgi:fido (protein-threonine AMPylation protein)
MIDDPEKLDPHYDFKHDLLANVQGITSRASLERFERVRAAAALIRLTMEPVRGEFDMAHLQEIHRRIFVGVYPWAGEFRHVNMSRQASHPFVTVQQMEAKLEKIVDKLGRQGHLKGLEMDDFAAEAGVLLGELNSVHPFRDGNGRVQREFVRELAEEAGFKINWSRVSREQMYGASDDNHNLGRVAGLIEVMWSAIEPTPVRCN